MRVPIWLTGLAMAAPMAQSQTAIPATAPTQALSAHQAAQPEAPPVRAGAVNWNGSELRVQGGGESLRSLLRQVSRTTGMKVTGGVPDEPVFGTYGPGPVQQVLASLLSGLSVNVMLVNGSPTLPKELLLSARTGGPTPPSAAQPLSVSDDPADVNMLPAQQPIGRHNSPNSFQQLPEVPNSSAAAPAVPINDAGVNGVPATDANGTPQSPNGVRTPEQIFDELRRRQQGNTVPR